MAKKETTQELKLKLVEYLLINGWEPNKEYRPSLIDERGCRELYGGGTEYYLISVNKDYAITIKTNVLTVHQASRNFCKVLSLNIADITSFSVPSSKALVASSKTIISAFLYKALAIPIR